MEEEVIDETTEKQEEEFTEAQNEITVELLLNQMESMQDCIDDLLSRLEKNEKTSQEEIGRLKEQNQAN